MASPAILLAVFLVFSSLLSPLLSLTCSSQKFSNNKVYARCSDLALLNAFIHWTYDAGNSTLSVAFVTSPAKPDGWIAWAINPTGTGMVGAQTLFALKDSKGGMVVKTYDIKDYSSIKESPKLWFDVKESAAEFSDGVMRLFATLVLPEKGKTTVNHVWQVGPSVTAEGSPEKHDLQRDNLNSKGTLDLLSGESKSDAPTNSKLKKRNIHGILNALSWGFLFPVGIIIARYLKAFSSADQPAWFYIHICCQLIAYGTGVAGYVIGLQLKHESNGIRHKTHGNIGKWLFRFATFQIVNSIIIRPNKDHALRNVWNILHHSLGYIILILSLVNVYIGFNILNPAAGWRYMYIGVIVVLVVIALLLEVITWMVVSKRKPNDPPKPDGVDIDLKHERL